MLTEDSVDMEVRNPYAFCPLCGQACTPECTFFEPLTEPIYASRHGRYHEPKMENNADFNGVCIIREVIYNMVKDTLKYRGFGQNNRNNEAT